MTDSEIDEVAEVAETIRVARGCVAASVPCEFCDLDGDGVGDDPGCRYIARRVIDTINAIRQR
jgi:hypothetical protein